VGKEVGTLGDLFQTIKAGRASVVTDHIETFTANGIRLKSGQELQADIIVTATGLQLQVFGGVELRIDGQPRALSELMTYKGVLMQDVPNLGWIMGYTNASWTLKADLAAHYICRLLNHMDKTGKQVAVPRAPAGMAENDTILGSLSSGYVRRASATLPRQGRELPWRMLHNYQRDRVMLGEEGIEDGFLKFTAAPKQPVLEPATALAA